MKNGLNVLILSLVLGFNVSLAGGGKRAPTPTPSPTVTTQPAPSGELPPVLDGKKGIGFDCVNCTEKEKVRLAEAERLSNEIVQGNCFLDFMLNWGLRETNGKSPIQVVMELRNTNLRVPVHYYRGRCKTVGYRSPPKPDIYFNRCSHDHYDACSTGSNGTHEWSHVLNYGHPKYNTSWRGKTVPYSINNAFDKCCVGSKKYR